MSTNERAPLDRTRPIPTPPGIADRLEKKLDKAGGPNSCWPFTGKTQNGGYGVLWTGGQRGGTIYAHRLAYKLHTGVDPISHAVCHRCDNPPCCNPGHLFLGSIADNVRDMMLKGRKATGGVPIASRARGEKVGSARLTDEQVREIRRRSAAGEGSGALGKAYDVDSSTIRAIVRRELWAHVGEAA